MDELQILERYYNGFINQETPSGFFNALVDYLEYADGVQSFDYITTLLLEKGEPLKEKVDGMAKKAVIQLDLVRKSLGKYLDKNKIENEHIEKRLQDYDVVRKRNENNVNEHLAIALHETLSGIIAVLASIPTYKPDVSEYIQYYKDSDTVSQFLSLHEMRELYIAKGDYEALEKNELWGQVSLLGQIFQVIKKGKRHQLSLQAGYKVFGMTGLDVTALNILVSEWEAVRDGKMPKMLNGSPRPRPILFDIQKIKPIASRLHLYLISEYADYEKTSNRLMKETEDKKRAESEIPVKNEAIYTTTPADALNITAAIKILDQEYRSFIDLSEPWNFFHGIADYVKTIEDMVPTKGIIEILENQRHIAEQAYKAIDAKALKELQVAAEEITKTIQASSIQSESIAQAMKSIQDQLSGATWSTDPLHYLDTKLFEIARGLKEIGHPEIVRPFEDKKKKVKNIYGNYTFSEAYNKVSEEKSKLEKRKQIEPWGAWEPLPLVKEAVFEPSERGDLYAQEMDAIRKGEASEDDIIFFKVKTYKQDAQRLHRFLMAQLTKIENEEKPHPMFKTAIKTPVSKSELKPKKNDKLIKQVNFVERKATGGPVYTFYINDDTADMRSLRADSFRLKELVKIIRGEDVAFKKDMLDYINSNKDCALYCAGKYKLTQIIEKDGESFRVCTGIKAEVKSETAHKKKMTHRRRA